KPACVLLRLCLNTASPKAGTLEGPGRRRCEARFNGKNFGTDGWSGRRLIGASLVILFLCFLTLIVYLKRYVGGLVV
ncbi:hypothetical protein, partial [Paracoccus sp. R86501]|uniref:hypothetical protein n=1 Tax=Paracoccus sp. R86501 TaxID=3101711 RepID=UPI00366D97CF